MRYGLVLAILLTAGCGTPASEAQPEPQPEPQSEPEWQSLFNGVDLTGWTPKIRGQAAGDDPAGTFRVRDSSIVVDYSQWEGPFEDRFGHLVYNTPFSRYRLQFEYRFLGEQVDGGPDWAWRNSGIMLHGEHADSMGLNQDFPVSIEMQLLGGPESGQRATANLCTPGTNVVMDGAFTTAHCIESTSDTYPGDDWVRGEVEVHGDSLIIHRIEGREVLRYTSPTLGGGAVSGHRPDAYPEGQALGSGHFSLQSESHPVAFRRIRLLDLSGN